MHGPKLVCSLFTLAAAVAAVALMQQQQQQWARLVGGLILRLRMRHRRSFEAWLQHAAMELALERRRLLMDAILWAYFDDD